MTVDEEYLQKAREYADRVRVMFAPSGLERGERGGRGPSSAADLAEQAEQLAQVSADLTPAAAAKLSEADPVVSAQAATQLLAKALTDLKISAYLLESALDEGDKLARPADRGAERGVSITEIDSYLKMLTGEQGPVGMTAKRGTRSLRNLTQVRTELRQALDDVLETITAGAGRAGDAALGGLVGLGSDAIKEAVGLVGQDILAVLGQAERVSRLYDLFRTFVVRVYEALVALLGPQVKTLLEQVQEWLTGFPQEALVSLMVTELYGLEETRRDLHERMAASDAALEQFAAGLQALDLLERNFREQTKLAEKLINGSKWVGNLATAILPQAELFLRAAYLVLGGYVLLVGADYVDAKRFRLLDRVAGVRRVIEANLKKS